MTHCVSVVVPTYNEAADIGETVQALVALEHDDLEVLIVDASDDATAAIVGSCRSPRVRLIRQTRGRGRAAARNEGILAARGDVIIVLNADVRLPPDFVSRILRHYAAGADYVLVESRVSNLEAAPARYVQALHELHYGARLSGPRVDAEMNWTEGFSCRREAAVAVGLFPEGTVAPLSAGEDGWFGEKLQAAGYRKAFDRSIVVSHVAPADISSFWRQRIGRGRGWPQMLRERHGWTTTQTAWVAIKVAVIRAVALVIPFPALLRGWRLSTRSPRRRADWLRMAALDWVDSLATVSGLIAGAVRPER